MVKTQRVGIYLYDQVEVLDFAGPYEVFTTATRVYGRAHPAAAAPFSVVTLSESGQTVRARAGLQVQVDHRLSDHPALDVVLIPGGVITAELDKPAVLQWLQAQGQAVALMASVCTGAFLLAKVGLLDDKSATTHWEDIDELEALFPQVQVQRERRWVDEGAVISSAGISAGIDMSLHIVARTLGREWALKTARQMDFDWQEDLDTPLI